MRKGQRRDLPLHWLVLGVGGAQGWWWCVEGGYWTGNGLTLLDDEDSVLAF